MMCWLAATGSVLLLLSGAAADRLTVAAERNSPAVQSAQTRPLGGVQLALEPRRAQVFVDGFYACLVDDFAGYYRHLTLPAGNHRIEVFAPGYQYRVSCRVHIGGNLTVPDAKGASRSLPLTPPGTWLSIATSFPSASFRRSMPGCL